METNVSKPVGFENDLSDYGPIIYDSHSGKPIAWGFEILNNLGDRFDDLRGQCELHCVYPNWFVVTNWLQMNEAIELYGEITEVNRGPKGGFKYVRFGTTQFGHRFEELIKK